MIERRHDHFSQIVLDGVELVAAKQTADVSIDDSFPAMDLASIHDFATRVPVQDLTFIEQAARLNGRLSDLGLREDYGLALGRTLQRQVDNRLLGGNLAQIEKCIRSMVGDIAGILCDGAKAGCSTKIATGAASAVKSALLALHGGGVDERQGIVEETADGCIRNLGRLSKVGMAATDAQIIDIMRRKGTPQLSAAERTLAANGQPGFCG